MLTITPFLFFKYNLIICVDLWGEKNVFKKTQPAAAGGSGGDLWKVGFLRCLPLFQVCVSF